MPDDFAIEWAQFDVYCPNCETLHRPRIGDAKRDPEMLCGACGATIRLDTPELLKRQTEAATAAFERAMKDADR